jgi:hypothetical protein
VDALLRKSWTYQRKNICMNLCVILSPVVLVTILGVLQSLVDNLVSEFTKVRCGPQ